jgi:hypothetical protein
LVETGYSFLKTEIGEVFSADFWFARTAGIWCAGYSGLEIALGDVGGVDKDAGKGEHIAVPKGAKEDGVSGLRGIEMTV